jgi:flagellar P-ring protein precursor FlgI
MKTLHRTRFPRCGWPRRCSPPPRHSAERIKDIASVAGVRANQLVGYGVVVGLDGSGDQTTQTPFTVQSMISMLSAMGINMPPGQSLQLKNVAAVMVTASLPAFARAGQTIDITVSSIGNAKSLQGRHADPDTAERCRWADLRHGPGQCHRGRRRRLRRRIQSDGESPFGRPHRRGRHCRTRSADAAGAGRIRHFELNSTDFSTAQKVVEAINRMAPGTATAADGRQVRVKAPQNPSERVAFIGRIENLDVTPAKMAAKVIVNSRTGSVVMNQAVLLDNCAVAHGNLSVSVSTDNAVSQPGALSGGQTAPVANAQDRDQAGRLGADECQGRRQPRRDRPRAELAGCQPAGPDRHPAGHEVRRRAARRAGNHLRPP